jgi:hypothetical protein
MFAAFLQSRCRAGRYLEIEAAVPLDAIYKTFHVPGKSSEKYYTADLLSDIMGRGKSSRCTTSW